MHLMQHFVRGVLNGLGMTHLIVCGYLALLITIVSAVMLGMTPPFKLDISLRLVSRCLDRCVAVIGLTFLWYCFWYHVAAHLLS
ncbi:hypothetical protein MKX01_005201 [Papaver californicum]|nr:hypothetical protein MKX01_005201 [Papaver californicum]